MPGINWLKNMIGFRLNDEQMKDIPFPYLELTVHITTKTVQSGAFLGMIVVAPIVSAIAGPRDKAAILDRSLRYGAVGCAIGAGIGPVMSLARFRTMDTDGAYDRSYRLRCNRNQVRVDRFSGLGALAGLATAAKLEADGKCTKTREETALSGMMVGMLSSFFYNLAHGDKHS